MVVGRMRGLYWEGALVILGEALVILVGDAPVILV